MRKIKWKKVDGYPKDRRILVNGIDLDCSYIDGQWCSYVCFGTYSKVGGGFDSLEDAQEDCVRLAKQILMDHYECLVGIMKGFDVSYEEIGSSFSA